MKNNKKRKGYETVWTCDYCGEEFKTKKESDRHELTCKKNKNREILLRIKVPDKQTIFVLVSIFLGIYLFTFTIVNSYAKENGLGKKYLTNPLNWFSSGVKDQVILTPTLTPTPEPSPTPSPKPRTQNTTNTGNTGSQIECIGPDGKHFNTSMTECKNLAEKWGKQVDYMVNCTLSEKCGGGSKRVSDSECANITCCQVGNNWSNYPSLEKCKQAQSEGSKTQPNNSNWEQYTTIGGGMTIKCEKNMDTIRNADAVHMNAANLYLSPDQGCFSTSPDTIKCAALKKDSDDKNQIFRNELKVGNCVLISHQ